MRQRTVLARRMQAALREVDLTLLPTGEPAKRLEPQPPETLFTRRSYTTPFNVGGNPPWRCAWASEGTACRFPCRSPGVCSTRRRCCAPATPTNERATPWRQRRPALVA
jgi:hypothetical protein